jgi:hypothetical protein
MTRAAAKPRPSWIVDAVLIVTFLTLAAWFLWGSPEPDPPQAPTPPVSRAALTTEPIRGNVSHDAVVTIGSFTRPCHDCHALFESPEEARPFLSQHQHIVLDHGLNDRCFNCHDRENRDRLALRGGETIAFSETPRLCAKCHGPTYRDWQRGMHGRTMFAWNPSSPEQVRLGCSECHDPHAPAFDPMRPLPGPNTLRMGEPASVHEGQEVEHVDPLRKWRPSNATAANAAGHGADEEAE